MKSPLVAVCFALVTSCAGRAPAPAQSAGAVASSSPAPEATGPIDRDGDGVADALDRCPDEAEDCDRHDDGDGCPDLDNDDDGILDVCDRCPDEPETYNGMSDEDGCPDRALVIVNSDIRIMPRVQFAEGSASVEPASVPVIQEIAHVLVANPQIERVRLRGNASLGEPNAERLSERRARAVRDLLIQHGVAAERLEVTAEGVTRPIAPNVTQAGRALNRRVDFEIVRTTPQPPASPRPVFVQPPRGQPGCPGSQSPPAPLPPPAGGCPRAARSRSVRSHAPLSGTALTKGSTSRWNA